MSRTALVSAFTLAAASKMFNFTIKFMDNNSKHSKLFSTLQKLITYPLLSAALHKQVAQNI